MLDCEVNWGGKLNMRWIGSVRCVLMGEDKFNEVNE